jgi:CubicO group peptidase (beta-lactamase class C family)
MKNGNVWRNIAAMPLGSSTGGGVNRKARPLAGAVRSGARGAIPAKWQADAKFATAGRAHSDMRRWISLLAVLAAVLSLVIVAAPALRSKDRRMSEMIHRFLAQHDIPGAVIAYGGVDAPPDLHAFGLADPGAGRAMAVSDRFKLASLSKPVTAAAILKLIETDPGLDLSTPLASLFGQVGNAADPRMGAVTVRHLLHHSAGWDRAESFDPFFLRPDALEARLHLRLRPQDDCAHVTEAMLDRPLQFDPGGAYAYSNIGYCWLGRIIAARSGMPYEGAVRRLLPEIPAGMSLDPGAVSVVHAVAPDEAGIAALRPDVIAAAGGWIGSAADYFAFAARPLDQDVFQAPSFAGAGQYYGLGWRIWETQNGRVLTHYGSMPGVFSVVARAPEGPVFVALFNGRPQDDLGAFTQLFGNLLALDLL